jgi:ATP-dependent Lon protease
LNIGESIGLVWTPFGGKIMYIETSKSKGNGKLHITGSAGDVLFIFYKVLNESVNTSLGWIKSNWKTIYLLSQNQNCTEPDFFNLIDFFIHFP